MDSLLQPLKALWPGKRANGGTAPDSVAGKLSQKSKQQPLDQISAIIKDPTSLLSHLQPQDGKDPDLHADQRRDSALSAHQTPSDDMPWWAKEVLDDRLTCIEEEREIAARRRVARLLAEEEQDRRIREAEIQRAMEQIERQDEREVVRRMEEAERKRRMETIMAEQEEATLAAERSRAKALQYYTAERERILSALPASKRIPSHLAAAIQREHSRKRAAANLLEKSDPHSSASELQSRGSRLITQDGWQTRQQPDLETILGDPNTISSKALLPYIIAAAAEMAPFQDKIPKVDSPEMVEARSPVFDAADINSTLDPSLEDSSLPPTPGLTAKDAQPTPRTEFSSRRTTKAAPPESEQLPTSTHQPSTGWWNDTPDEMRTSSVPSEDPASSSAQNESERATPVVSPLRERANRSWWEELDAEDSTEEAAMQAPHDAAQQADSGILHVPSSVRAALENELAKVRAEQEVGAHPNSEAPHSSEHYETAPSQSEDVTDHEAADPLEKDKWKLCILVKSLLHIPSVQWAKAESVFVVLSIGGWSHITTAIGKKATDAWNDYQELEVSADSTEELNVRVLGLDSQDQEVWLGSVRVSVEDVERKSIDQGFALRKKDGALVRGKDGQPTRIQLVLENSEMRTSRADHHEEAEAKHQGMVSDLVRTGLSQELDKVRAGAQDDQHQDTTDQEGEQNERAEEGTRDQQPKQPPGRIPSFVKAALGNELAEVRSRENAQEESDEEWQTGEEGAKDSGDEAEGALESSGDAAAIEDDADSWTIVDSRPDSETVRSVVRESVLGILHEINFRFDMTTMRRHDHVVAQQEEFQREVSSRDVPDNSQIGPEESPAPDNQLAEADPRMDLVTAAEVQAGPTAATPEENSEQNLPVIDSQLAKEGSTDTTSERQLSLGETVNKNVAEVVSISIAAFKQKVFTEICDQEVPQGVDERMKKLIAVTILWLKKKLSEVVDKAEKEFEDKLENRNIVPDALGLYQKQLKGAVEKIRPKDTQTEQVIDTVVKSMKEHDQLMASQPLVPVEKAVQTKMEVLLVQSLKKYGELLCNTRNNSDDRDSENDEESSGGPASGSGQSEKAPESKSLPAAGQEFMPEHFDSAGHDRVMRLKAAMNQEAARTQPELQSKDQPSDNLGGWKISDFVKQGLGRELESVRNDEDSESDDSTGKDKTMAQADREARAAGSGGGAQKQFSVAQIVQEGLDRELEKVRHEDGEDQEMNSPQLPALQQQDEPTSPDADDFEERLKNIRSRLSNWS